MDDHALSPFAKSAAQRRALAQRLVAWFRRTARDLPWRRTKDLYAIWVSEVMLQQTQVATVISYYQRFLGEFPDVAALAAASEQRVLRLWEGLGYYRRARQLHAAARQIVAEHGGRFPTQFAAVRSLPGIGRYTAGAVLSIGAGARLPIVEANSARVLSRLAAFRGQSSSTAGQRHLWSLAEALLPVKQVGAFNQALMELGSQVCTPRQPACDECPLAEFCLARAGQLQEQIPAAAKKTNYQDVTETAVVVRRGTQVLLRKCQDGERWAGLWDFPRFAQSGAPESLAEQSRSIAEAVARLTGFPITLTRRMTTLKHGVTRFRITLECYEARLATRPPRRQQPPPRGEVRWVAIAGLAEFPLSTTGRRIAKLLANRPAATGRSSRRAATPRG